MLTSEMEKALVVGIRKQQAARIIKERKLYRSGINNLSRSSTYQYITHKTINVKEVIMINKDSLLTLNTAFEDATKCMAPCDYGLDIDFFVEECNCEGYCYCGELAESKALIVKSTYEFKKLKQVQRSIKSLIDYCVRDAKFKLVRQPNGKDTKRFLKVINENM